MSSVAVCCMLQGLLRTVVLEAVQRLVLAWCLVLCGERTSAVVVVGEGMVDGDTDSGSDAC